VKEESMNRSVSRRSLLKGAAAAAAATAATGCADGRDGAPAADVDAPAFGPLPPEAPRLNCNLLSFFAREEARTVEAITGRILPGSADDPGAIEACATAYIDQKLGQFEGAAQPTYSNRPFARGVTRRAGSDQGARDAIAVAADQLPRYGPQSPLSPQESYRQGLRALDRYCRRRFRSSFVDLSESRQDRVLEALERDRATGFYQPSASDFFELVHQDTIEGVFCDPAYGGNRDMVGWKLIGWPGAQRAYTAREMKRGTNRPPQPLARMHPSLPGHPDNGPDYPVSGSDHERHAG
jgi:gluconate 2-dehydrogenase gamma chain